MLRIIAVDDERKALDRFKQILEKDKRVEVLGTFTTAHDALEFIKRNTVDIVFLDIEMPLMSGLELGEILTRENPDIQVVFITAHDQYALDAFQVHATGYLLKPLNKEDVGKQIDHIIRKLNVNKDIQNSDTFMVKCFGHFVCYPYDNEEEILRWRTSKTEELFALLIHYQGKPMSKEIIIDTLWPELEYRNAANNFRVTCTYLRNAFTQRGIKDILLRERDNYRINLKRLRCDALDFAEIANQFFSQGLKIDDMRQAGRLYKGAYMENKAYDWLLEARAWFFKAFIKLQNQIADICLIEKKYQEACEAMESILEREPLSEEAVKRLVSIKYEMGDTVSSIGIYGRYKKKLYEEMGIQPSISIQELFEEKILRNQ